MDNTKISDKTKLIIIVLIALFEISFIQFNKDKPRIAPYENELTGPAVTETFQEPIIIGGDAPTSQTVKTIYDNELTNQEFTDQEEMLFVHYLDVGQADAIYIGFDDFDMVIDAGNNEDGPYVVDYLKRQGVETIELMVASHAHEDHIGGLDDVIKSFEIKTIIDSGEIKDSKTYQDYMKAAKESNAVILNDDNRQFEINEFLKVEIIEAMDGRENTNNNSVIVKVTFKEKSFLFTGDLEEDIEDRILTKNISADVFKAAHHGSSTSNSDMFLRRVQPALVIISAGANNKYGHPHTEAIERLMKQTKELFGTWENGNIIVKTDGYTLIVDANERVTLEDAAAGGEIKNNESKDSWWKRLVKPSKIDTKKDIKKQIEKEIIKEATKHLEEEIKDIIVETSDPIIIEIP